ncbi:MAG: HDIG domain-containing metalloprotein [bacterium]
MKQWLSKFRSQRLKERFKDGIGRKTPEDDLSWWNRPLFSLLIGLLLWGAACALLLNGIDPRSGSLQATFLHAGNEVLLLIITAVSATLLKVLTPDILRNNTRLMLLAMCALTTAISGSLLIHDGGRGFALPQASADLLVPVLIPFALSPLLAGILLGGSAALVAGLWSTLTCLVIGNFTASILLSGIIATATAAVLIRRLRRRTQLIRVGLTIGLLQIASLAVMAGQLPMAPHLAGKLVLACVASGLGAALLALLLLPLFELLFGVTSNMTLLELSDLAHPLLQRLAFEAPGTYHHSLMVANLAQAAADEIGANSVLARVGAYFHDIGKVTKPGYFTENIRTGDNPHDGLTPSMSAMLVMAHLKEGLTLAMLHKLPRPVMDIIQQHHGTGLVYYFHHKAGQRALADTQSTASRGKPVVDESSYRYPGPKPYSREAAIIMLADAVEAASRSLEKPTPAGIAELVDRITEGRIEDNQLDNCEMTLVELCRVKRAFVFCLSNMLHSRIAYPKP